jgi:hypothetical protein
MTLNISNTVNSDLTNAKPSVTVDSMSVDAPQDQKETTWQNTRWTQQWGYFNKVPDLKAALVLKAVWNVGGGYTADPETTVILDHISGYGGQTFLEILFDMDIVSSIGGDAYCEIIRDGDVIINLKSLNPENIVQVYNEKGILIRYEQTDKIKKNVKTFEPNEIFHISNLRLAGQMHGISDIDPLEQTILADNESFTDTKKLMHYQARPLILWKLKTDDPTKIAAVKAKIDSARNLGEDTFIPDDDETISHEIVAVNPSQLVMSWRSDMRNRFFRGIGLPEILPSGAEGSSESSGKIGYLAFERVVKHKQKFYENQIWNQLNLKISLVPPASLENPLNQDAAKDGMNAFKPSDTIAGAGA